MSKPAPKTEKPKSQPSSNSNTKFKKVEKIETEKPKSQPSSNSNNKFKKVENKSKGEKGVHRSPIERSYGEECISKSPRRTTETNFNKKLSENFIELEEKVDFLLQTFKDHGRKNQEEKMSSGGVCEDVWHLLNLNKRVAVVEEGINNISVIIEELLKESTQRKETYIEKSLGLSGEEEDVEDMSPAQRITLLKNRNDLLTCFMKALLKVGTIEEMSARLAYIPKDQDFKQLKKEPKKRREQPVENKVDKVNTVQELVSAAFPEKDSFYSHVHDSYASKVGHTKDSPENGTSAGKLESSSEQSEPDCRFNRRAEAEKVIEEIKRKTASRNLKGKFSQVSESIEDLGEDLSKEKLKLFSNESLLMSSLEQARDDFFSKLESTKKNLENIGNQTQGSETETELETSSDSPRPPLSSIIENHTTETESVKPNVLSSIPEECSPPVRKNKIETLSNNLRPMTAPVTTKPPLRSSMKKPAVREEKAKINTEITNNLKNKNKNLLNKKAFVRTL